MPVDIETLRERLPKVTAASLTDALWRTHAHAAHVLDLVTPTPGRVLFGSAVTIPFVPVRKDADKAEVNFAKLFYEGVGEDAAGKVIVMANYGAPDAAVAGGTKLARFEKTGVAGLLTNGRLRDFHEVREYGFAAYCRGEMLRAGSLDIMPVAANVPVAIDGATVMPGDYIYADDAGAVIIPARDVLKVMDLAISLEEKDAERIAAVMVESRDDVLRRGAEK